MLRTVRGIRRTGPDTTFAQGDWCGAQAEYVRGCAVLHKNSKVRAGRRASEWAADTGVFDYPH